MTHLTEEIRRTFVVFHPSMYLIHPQSTELKMAAGDENAFVNRVTNENTFFTFAL